MNPTVDHKTLLGLVVRTIIAGYAGGLVAEGKLNPQDAETLSGAGLIAVVLGWSYVQKRLAAKQLAKAERATREDQLF